MKNKFTILFFFFLSAFTIKAQDALESTTDNKQQQRYFDINKNIDIFNSVLREVDLFYVDSININKLVRSGIDDMLKTLDPYTEYYNTDDMKEFNTEITGEYAGVGAIIGIRMIK